MKKTLYLTASLLLAGSACLSSCQEDYENVAEHNKVYSTSSERIATTLLDGKADEVTKTLSASLAEPVGQDVKITYAAAPEMVEAYNSVYNQNAVILPEENYTIDVATVEIPAGNVQSSNFEITFNDLLNLDDTQVYVLPVSIVKSDVEVLPESRTTYFVFRGAALINVVGGLKETCLTFVNEGNTPALNGLTQLTVECLINPDAFDNTLSTIIGIEGKFLFRIGDAGVPSNQIQLATSNGNVTDAAWQLEIGKWTFVTLTWDSSTGAVEVYFNGVKKGNTQTTSYRSSVNWGVQSSDRACYVGYAYDTNRYFDGKISQLRVWDKVLTNDEINARNHFYRVDNDADGLVLYLKFDEGAGNYVHDYANGYDMAVPATYPGKSNAPDALQWYNVTLP